MIRLLFFALFAPLIFTYLTAPGSKRNRAARYAGTLFAHRGLHGPELAENGMGAFAAAADADCGIELDVRASVDGDIYVFHDAKLSRMCGNKEKLCKLPSERIDSMSLTTGERIPRLDSVLQMIDGKVPLLIEIKGSHKIFSLSRDVVSCLKAYSGEVLVESFNPIALFFLRLLAPDIPRGQLLWKLNHGCGAAVWTCMLTAFLSRPDFYACGEDEIGRRAVRLHRFLYRTPTAIWTVRSRERLNEARARGEMVIFENIEI